MRWKTIGREVFQDIHHAPVTLHPHGRSWVGNLYAGEEWLDIVGYQSSHSNSERTVNWINQGPITNNWSSIPPRPIINMEPNYEEIHFRISAEDVRNASYWSVFATPPAGITYGANGIWPWLREGETILYHNHEPGTSTWKESIDFPGSLQIGYLSELMQQFRWWELKPDTTLLVEQPGKEVYNHYVPLLRSADYSTLLTYLPVASALKIRNPLGLDYLGRWFDPVNNQYEAADIQMQNGVIEVSPTTTGDKVLILEQQLVRKSAR